MRNLKSNTYKIQLLYRTISLLWQLTEFPFEPTRPFNWNRFHLKSGVGVSAPFNSSQTIPRFHLKSGVVRIASPDGWSHEQIIRNTVLRKRVLCAD